MKPFRVPSYEIEQRISRLQKGLQEQNMGALFIIQRVDLYYFSGTAQNGCLFIPAQGDPLLFIKKYIPRARAESSIKDIIEIRAVKEVPKMIHDYYGSIPGLIGLEFDVMPVKDFNFFQKHLFPAQTLIDGSALIHHVRMIKSKWEIEQMGLAADLSRMTFEYIRNSIQPGLTEIEFAGMYETFARKHGHGGQLRVRDYLTEGFNWHILSGTSGGMVGLIDSPASGEGTSAAFPCGGGHKPLQANEPIMIDTGLVLNGFHMDETRMFSIGDMPPRAMKASQAAIEIHNALLEKAKPGISLGDLYDYSVSMAESLGYGEQYLGPPGHKVTFVGHSIGHELVEPPIIAQNREDPLQPGMVFALEPKLVFQDEFIAGIESIFCVTPEGSQLISKVPAEIFIC